MPYEIPLTNSTAQTFRVELDGVNYNFRVIWNERSGVWTFSIYDVDFNTIIAGIPIVLGADLIAKYALNIGGFATVDTSGTGVDATSEDIGSRVKLIYLTQDEVDNGFSI